MEIEQLKENILTVVSDNSYNLSKLNFLLDPIPLFTNDPFFIKNIKNLVKIVTKDRDGNNVFNLKDLQLLCKDTLALSSLITLVLLILSGLPKLSYNNTYKEGKTEEILFKLLAYVFLIVVPRETQNTWTYEEKNSVLSLVLLMYQIVRSSEIAKNIMVKIIDWMKSKKICSCLTSEEQKQNIAEKKLPKIEAQLGQSLQYIKDKNKLLVKINKLKKKAKKP